MRIVAGSYRGRRIAAPRGAATRPTSDRVREALFSILGARVEGAQVLDLFAGSGALGLEALSRGAAAVTFVDSAPRAIAAIEANLGALGVRSERTDSQSDPAAPRAVAVRRSDAMRFLRSAPERGAQYDLAFLDPPYALAPGLGTELSEALPPALAPGATVVTESDRRQPLDLDLPLHDERRYGDTLIRIHGAK